MRRIEKKFVSPKICTKIKQIAYGSEKTVPREEPSFNRGLHNLMFFVFAKGQTETTASIFSTITFHCYWGMVEKNGYYFAVHAVK